MVTFILIPGAGGVSWYWHRITPLLEAAGHAAIAVDLPGNDPSAGLAAYADRVVDAIDRREEVVLVAQSLGGFTAPLVCERVAVRILVFVNAMIPVPGETADEWGNNTGSAAARIAAANKGGFSPTYDEHTYFWHDVAPDLIEQGAAYERDEADMILTEPCRFESWPEVPIHVIAGLDDRLFPVEFQRRVAKDRLHVEIDTLPGGHLIALSNPGGLADRLLEYVSR